MSEGFTNSAGRGLSLSAQVDALQPTGPRNGARVVDRMLSAYGESGNNRNSIRVYRDDNFGDSHGVYKAGKGGVAEVSRFMGNPNGGKGVRSSLFRSAAGRSGIGAKAPSDGQQRAVGWLPKAIIGRSAIFLHSHAREALTARPTAAP